MNLTISFSEEYSELSLIKRKPKQKPKPLPKIPSLNLTVRVKEEYTEEPKQERQEKKEENPFGELSLEDFKLKEHQALISQRRRRRSQAVASTTMMSSKKSLSEKLCLRCGADLKIEVIYIKVNLKNSAHYLCRFCNEIERSEELFQEYSAWVAEQMFPTDKWKKPIKRTQKDKIPDQKVWQEAYLKDTHSQNKGRSSLHMLEESLNKWRHN